jgi:hypothetical protein
VPVSIGSGVGGSTPGSVLFIDTSGALAQDNANFFWDDVNFNLTIQGSGTGQGAFKVGGANAIFRVPNGSGANWFEDGAGNFTTTGYQNFGAGDGTMAAMTSGSQNCALGAQTLRICTTGTGNMALGSSSFYNLTTGSANTGIGTLAFAGLTTGNHNVGLGYNVLGTISATGFGGYPGADNNVVIGYTGMQGATSAVNTVAIGTSVAHGVPDSYYDTYLGTNAGEGLNTGHTEFNTFIGGAAAQNVTGGQHSTFIGSWPALSTVLSNVIAFSYGQTLALDWNINAANVWSMTNGTNAQGLHVYKTWDGAVPTVNYERGILDWNPTSNIFRLASQAGGTGTVRLIAVDGFQKAGAPAAGDLPSGTFALVNDTSGGQTWLAYNAAGTIRKVQLV